MLYIALQSLGSYPLSIDNDVCLHVNFARQLEYLDKWQLAVFVLLHINEPSKYVILFQDKIENFIYVFSLYLAEKK